MEKDIRRDITEVDPIQKILSELQIEEPLAQAMNRWKETLFERDFSDNFHDYFRRVDTFNGYHPGDAVARGFENDSIGQLCGTVGQLKYSIAVARAERRDLYEHEIERTRENFLKAAEMRGRSAAKYEKYAAYLGPLHRAEQEQIVLLADNVPTIIQVIKNLDQMN